MPLNYGGKQKMKRVKSIIRAILSKVSIITPEKEVNLFPLLRDTDAIFELRGSVLNPACNLSINVSLIQ